MNHLIDDIITDMKKDYNLSRFDLEKIIDSQFKVLVNHMQSKDLREVHFKGLGKVKPTTFFIAYQNGRIQKKPKEHNSGMGELPVQ